MTSSIDIWALILSVLSIITSSLFAYFVWKSTTKLGQQQNNLQNQSIQIALYDKRISLYRELFILSKRLTLYRSIVTTRKSSIDFYKNMYDDLGFIVQEITDYGIISEFLFNDNIAKYASSIITITESIRANLYTYINFHADIAFDEFKEEVVKQIDDIQETFSNTNLLGNIAECLKIAS